MPLGESNSESEDSESRDTGRESESEDSDVEESGGKEGRLVVLHGRERRMTAVFFWMAR